MFSQLKVEGQLFTGRIEEEWSKLTKLFQLLVWARTKSQFVTGVWNVQKQLEDGQAGDNVGLLLEDLKRQM